MLIKLLLKKIFKIKMRFRLEKRIIPIIILILAIYYARDILHGNIKSFLSSVSKVNYLRRLRHFGRGFSLRTFSMINKGIKSFKNQEIVKNIIKNHNKKKNNVKSKTNKENNYNKNK